MLAGDFVQKLGALNADAVVQVTDNNTGITYDVTDVKHEFFPDTNSATLWITVEEH